MKLDIGLLTHDLKGIGEYARKAESLGFDCLWSSETQHDPFLPLAVAAANTAKIKLGTYIAVAFPRSPMITAYIAWDLQAASDGRFILGLGTQVKGHNERRFSVKWESPGPKLREIILALRAIWDCWQNKTKLDFHGQFYAFTLMNPLFQPDPIAHPRIPIFIAGVNPYMCRLVGKLCEGLHVHPFNSPKYLRDLALPALEEGLRKSGRTRSDVELFASAFAAVGDTEKERQEAERAIRQQIAFYASTRTYEPVLAAHGWQELAPKLHRKSVEGDWNGMAELISDEMLDTYAVSGTYASIARRLKERYAGLLDRVALYTSIQPEIDDPRLPGLIKRFNG